jgi:hypothetical protein
MSNEVIDWLLEGDPVIRWQVMRDLLGAEEAGYEAERRRIPEMGWGARFIDCLRPDGTWPPGRWTDTVWTLLILMDCGMPADCPPINAAARQFVDHHLTNERAADEKWLISRIDLCHLGFWLRIGAYFIGHDPRLRQLSAIILQAQMPDGGWNCRKRNYPHTSHSSFHTTFNILEGLSAAADAGLVDPREFRASEMRALEFMLAHRMYRSDKTGDIVSDRFTYLTFPSHWHYTILRGLDYMRSRPEIGDPRLDDAVSLLKSRRKENGRWPVEKRIPGTALFDMEKMGGDSRWNTLRALRVLKEQDGQGAIFIEQDGHATPYRLREHRLRCHACSPVQACRRRSALVNRRA